MLKPAVILLSLAPFMPAQTTDARQAAASRSQSDNAGVRRAIAFQRLKDREDATQARKERQQPARYDYSADRKAGNASTVKDPGPLQYRRHANGH
jgi:hypothetical protein